MCSTFYFQRRMPIFHSLLFTIIAIIPFPFYFPNNCRASAIQFWHCFLTLFRCFIFVVRIHCLCYCTYFFLTNRLHHFYFLCISTVLSFDLFRLHFPYDMYESSENSVRSICIFVFSYCLVSHFVYFCAIYFVVLLFDVLVDIFDAIPITFSYCIWEEDFQHIHKLYEKDENRSLEQQITLISVKHFFYSLLKCLDYSKRTRLVTLKR